MAYLELEGLSFTYPEAAQSALTDISLQIERGELVALLGATGSGKSTLLRLLKPELRQNGTIQGEVMLDGRSVGSLSSRESAGIGYVAQNPDEQLVTDKVWHELAFTLENLGAPREQIARRIAETSAFFDIDSLYSRNTATLSGGQKQLINLAAVMTADPELLLLDEPTAQLDPIAATRFIETVCRLNRELGLTVIVSEHRTEELFSLCDRVIVLEHGAVIYNGKPREIAERISSDSPYLSFLPAATRLFRLTGGRGEAPLSIREGQRYVSALNPMNRAAFDESKPAQGEPALELKNVYFRYERNGADILSDLSMSVNSGEVFALLGSNGAGKSTAAAVAAGLRKPLSGSVKLFGKRLKDYRDGSLYRGNLSLLPQDVESLFLCETVREELKGCEEVLKNFPYDLSRLYDRHPYDLSGGERQLVALCKALSTRPRVLLMDEPSKGLDGGMKRMLIELIKEFKAKGMTVVLISHDVEFAAMCADRCALFAQGGIAAVDTAERFFSDNRFYTTAASRMTRLIVDGAYTVERAARILGGDG